MESIRTAKEQECQTELKTNSRICDDGNFLEDKFKRFTLFINALIERNEQVKVLLVIIFCFFKTVMPRCFSP